MEPTLYELLRTTQVEETNAQGPSYTHMTLHGPRKTWTISSSKLSEFWGGYCNLAAEKPHAIMGLAEKPIDHMPIIVKWRLPFSVSPNGGKAPEALSFDFILDFVTAWQQAIYDRLKLTDSETQLRCLFLRDVEPHLETAPNGDVLSVRSYRLQFPTFKTPNVGTQQAILRTAIQTLRDRNIVRHLGRQPAADWDQMVTLAGIDGQPVTMYMSTTDPAHPKMELEYIFHSITQERIHDGSYIAQLSDIFNPNDHIHVQQRLIRPDLIDDDTSHWLPMLLSVHYGQTVLLPQAMSPPAPTHLPTPIPTPTPSEVGQEVKETPLELARRFLGMLSQKRIEEDFYWRNIGEALYSASGGSPEGLQVWQHYTEQVPDREQQRDPNECATLWRDPIFRKTNITLKTLAWFAREDNPTEYDKWHTGWYREAVVEAASTKHDDVAKAVYRVYWLEFANSDMTKDGWYHFREHRWFPSQKAVGLSRFLTSTNRDTKKEAIGFLGIYEKLRAELAIEIQNSTDRLFRENGEIKMKKYTNIIDRLKSHPFQQNILSACLKEFYDEKFKKALDTNPNTLGMLNGVIEVLTTTQGEGIAAYRPGKPEDYITKSTLISFDTTLHREHPKVVELLTWFGQVFVDPQLQNHFLKIAASFLRGRNAEKRFHIWSGESGDNSKSMIIKLLQQTFGEYCVDFPVSMLSGKETQSSSASPDVAQAKGAHIGVLSEPDEKDDLKGGKIKRWTGGDRMFGRFLHENGGSFENFVKMILMCNTPPAIPTGGQAVENRLTILPFLSRWVLNPPEKIEDQYAQGLFKMDPFFENKIPGMVEAFMWVMVQYYPIYIAEGLVDPPKVKEYTEQYWKDNDPYKLFIEAMIKPVYVMNQQGQPTKDDRGRDVRDQTVGLTQANLYKEFKIWYKDNYPNVPIPKSSAVKAELQRPRHLGPMHGNRWIGIKLDLPAANVPTL